MIPSTIPWFVPRWLLGFPQLITLMLAGLTRLRRIKRLRVKLLLVAVALLLCAVIAVWLVTHQRVAIAVQYALSHAAVVIIAAGILSVSRVAKRRRILKVMQANSWLVATPLASLRQNLTSAILVACAFVWPLGLALGIVLLVSLGDGVTLFQSIRLSIWIVAGTIGGVICGWLLPVRTSRIRFKTSRYASGIHRGHGQGPSGAGLSHWPIAQAIGWSRPENSRLLLAVSLLTLPAGISGGTAIGVLAIWLLASSLVAVLAATDAVSATAAEWLRPSPITLSIY